MTLPSTFQFSIIFGMGFEVLTGFVMWSELGRHRVWYTHGYECVGGAFFFCLHGPSVDGSGRFRPDDLY